MSCVFVFVVCSEGENSSWYYSSTEAFDEVLEVLDADRYEKTLFENLLELRDEACRQFDITLTLTKKLKGNVNRKSVLEIEAGWRMIDNVVPFYE